MGVVHQSLYDPSGKISLVPSQYYHKIQYLHVGLFSSCTTTVECMALWFYFVSVDKTVNGSY